MKLFRTVSTARLIAIAAVVVVVAAGGAFAVAATGGSGTTPAPKPLAQAIHDALAGAKPDGVTARIGFTNTLFPSGSIVGQAGSALISSATGRLWANQSGGRLELQSDAGDAQIVWNDKKITVYDASSNTAYVADLPQSKDAATQKDHPGIPSVDEITKVITELGKSWTVSGAEPTNTGGQESYTVRVSPSHDGGLLGSAELAFDALRGVPLKVAIYAQGASSPVLALEATNVSYGSVPDSDVQVPPPAGAKIVDLSSQAQSGGHENGDKSTPPVSGLDAVTKAATFTVVAPDTLVGLPRQDVRLVGGKTVLAVYGQGLGAVVLVERAVDSSGPKGASPLDQLPVVTLDGVNAHELATQLGTVLTWDRNGVSYVLAGSLPSAAAEAAARSLK
ncbi:MAG: LolA family protein [Gaiellaceae bacterium]